MAEILTYGTPQSTGAAPTATTIRMMALYKRREPWSIQTEIVVDELLPSKRVYVVRIEGSVAQTLVTALNKTNFTIKSEERTVIEWCQSHNDPATGAPYVPAGGTFSGSPD